MDASVTFKEMPTVETWSETGRISWVSDGNLAPVWLGREWRCVETGETMWKPVETIIWDGTKVVTNLPTW